MKITVSIFILLFHYFALASQLALADKIQIVTTITPLSAIIAMLVKDQAKIQSIASSNGCPHHYHLKPSDLQKVQNADIIFYIDPEFDGFISKLINGGSKHVIQISSLPGLNIIKNNSYNNWHIWLDLDNVIILLEQLSKILVEQFPTIKIAVEQNLEAAKKQIAILAQIKQQQLSRLQDVILLTDSCEYFFNNNQYRVTKLYNSNQKSLKYINELEQLLTTSYNKCLILSLEQNPLIYQNLKAIIVAVDSENWQVDKINDDLFYTQYLKMINQVTKCVTY